MPQIRLFLLAMIGPLIACSAVATTPPPGLKDYERFPAREVTASASPRVLPLATPGQFLLPRTIALDGADVDFREALERSGTAGWLVLHRGEVVDEQYFGGRDANTLFPIFSVTKSIVGTLAAVARERGDAPDPSADAVGQLAAALGPRFRCRGVTWRMLLDMRTGIDFSEVYDDAESDVGRLYLAANLDAESAAYRCSPGRPFRYASIDTQWLAVALEGSTGLALDRQLSQRLWEPMGAAEGSTWNTDEQGRIKGFCCLNTRARDLARFGQLMVDRGQREGVAVLPAAWIDGLLERARKGEAYADQWWLLHDSEALTDGSALLARGILGQFVFVHPDAEIVIVRVGDREGSMPWLPLFGAIVNANLRAD